LEASNKSYRFTSWRFGFDNENRREITFAVDRKRGKLVRSDSDRVAKKPSLPPAGLKINSASYRGRISAGVGGWYTDLSLRTSDTATVHLSIIGFLIFTLTERRHQDVIMGWWLRVRWKQSMINQVVFDKLIEAPPGSRYYSHYW